MRMKPAPAPAPRRPRAFVARDAARRPARGAAPAEAAPEAPRDRKAATNLSLSADLVRRARALGLNLSQIVEAALATAVRAAEQERWLAENERAIEQYNTFVERHGAFGDEHRGF